MLKSLLRRILDPLAPLTMALLEALDSLLPDTAVFPVVIGSKILLNVVMTALVVNAVGPETTLSVVAAGLTILSASILGLVLFLQQGVFLARLELLMEVVLIAVGGYALSLVFTPVGLVAVVIVAIGSIALLPLMAIIYAEATIAP